MNLWTKWKDCHDHPSQVDRQERAREAILTPLSISGQRAQFQGEEDQYRTTLLTCSCPDFKKRHKPCKHMYRLAMELDLFPRGNMQTDANAIRIPASQHSKITADLIALIDSYPTEQQSDLKMLLYTLVIHKEPALTPVFPLVAALADTGCFQTERDFLFLFDHYPKRKLSQKIDALGIGFPADLKTQTAKREYVREHITEYGEQLFPDEVKLTIPERYSSIANTIYRHLLHTSDQAAADELIQQMDVPQAMPSAAKTAPTPTHTAPQPVHAASLGATRSKWVVLALALFLGGLGVHRFYTGKIKSGIVWLLTCGLFGFGWLCDVIAILINRFDLST